MAVTITPTGPADAVRLAQRLLHEAGPERHDEVRTIWHEHAGVAFVVPDDLARTVLGLVAQTSRDGRAAVDDPASDADQAAPVEAAAAVVTDSAAEPAAASVVPVVEPVSDATVAQAPKRAARTGSRKRAGKSSVEFSGS